MDDARRAAERVARVSYGRLVALLAARTRDIAAAEDALAEAFAAALRTWPDRGVPDAPEAWLLTAARRAFGHRVRHDGVKDAADGTLRLIQAEIDAREAPAFPDERLKLLFVCAHPAIDPAVRTPLMLQTVLGLDAARIAAAFLVQPSAMAQRLVRAKTKIRDAGLRFEIPESPDLPERLSDVFAAVYAAYGTAWDATPGADDERRLGEEAIYLARLLVALLPAEPEAKGLLALMLHCEARRDARRAPDGSYVPLAEQASDRWSRAMIGEAERLLADASALAQPGRYQTEAAIQSLHVHRAVATQPTAPARALLYDVLASQVAAVGVRVARAAAHAEAFGPAAGLALLDALDPEQVASYQPYWATRAELLRRIGDATGADSAFDRAIGLSQDPGIRAYLLGRRRTA